MKQTIIIVLLLVTLLPLPISCNKRTYSNYLFEVETIELNHGRVTMENGYYWLDPVGINDSIHATSFGISFQAETWSTSEVQSIASSYFNPLLPLASADPIPPTSDSKIALISIYPSDSLHTVESGSFGPDETLLNLFSISSQYTGFSDKKNILQFIETEPLWYLDDVFLLHLKNELMEPYEGSFEVKITMENGEKLSSESEVVNIY